jgi:hypothetical protein
MFADSVPQLLVVAALAKWLDKPAVRQTLKLPLGSYSLRRLAGLLGRVFLITCWRRLDYIQGWDIFCRALDGCVLCFPHVLSTAVIGSSMASASCCRSDVVT